MVLLTYALLHRKLAKEELFHLSDENVVDKGKEVCATLNTAAGILEYVASNCLPYWSSTPQQIPIPEIFPQTFTALIKYGFSSFFFSHVLQGFAMRNLNKS